MKTKAPKGAPRSWDDSGNIEVESTPEGVLIRLRFPDGDEAGVEVNSDMAIDVAATMFFCALRHAKNADAATEAFMQRMNERGREMSFSAILAPRPGKPS